MSGRPATVHHVNEPDEITTARLLLRRLRPEDESAFVDVHTDPATHRYRVGGARTRDQARALLDTFIAEWDRDGVGYWTMILPATGETVGFGGLRPSEEEDERVLNLYYRLRTNAWGHGYAPEMATAALDWARRERPGKPVVIVTRPGNEPARRVADKLGFRYWCERDTDGTGEVLYRLP